MFIVFIPLIVFVGCDGENANAPEPDEESGSPATADLESAVKLTAEPLPTSESVTEAPAAEKPTKMVGFIKAQGTLLVDGNGDNFLIKGMAFGNNVWANPAVAPKNHHTEESYKELSEIGFNSVRFYLNYGLFEKDSDPYNYDGMPGWDWLDWNIRMARRYNIRLVLNMHYPQGGFQSNGDGMELWTKQENQDRLTALWTEIAGRYKDEIAIGGFDLLNEPYVAEKATLEETFAQWSDLAQRIAYSIRTVDTNHLILVERLNAYKNVETGVSDWSGNLNGNLNFFLIDDPNVAYEFHTYDPFKFTHQNASWVPSSVGVFATYPDENYVEVSGEQPWAGAIFDNPKLDRKNTEWQELKGIKYKVDNDKYKVGTAAVQVQNIGADGKVWIDDITVNEYDENGEFVRQVCAYNFDESGSWGYWSSDGSGKLDYIAAEGHDAKGCLLVSGTTSDANTSDWNNKFLIKQGYHYEISGWIKGENIGTRPTVTFRVDFLDAEEVNAMNKDYLKKAFTKFLKFGTDNNVPLYLGEFGVISYGFEEDRGGDRWIKDALDICRRYNINFNYHTYHEENFGLYRNNSNVLPDKLNIALFEAFKEALKDN